VRAVAARGGQCQLAGENPQGCVSRSESEQLPPAVEGMGGSLPLCCHPIPEPLLGLVSLVQSARNENRQPVDFMEGFVNGGAIVSASMAVCVSERRAAPATQSTCKCKLLPHTWQPVMSDRLPPLCSSERCAERFLPGL